MLQVYLNFKITKDLTRLLSTSPVKRLKQKWRLERGLPMNPNACGVLTDSPDYSYLDGRPTPLGVGQRERFTKQQQLTQKIIQLSSEIDFALDRHKKMNQEEQEKKEAILRSKLKPKGIELLKKHK